jgi:DNA polymerase
MNDLDDLQKLATLHKLKSYGYRYLDDDALDKLSSNNQDKATTTTTLKVPNNYEELKTFVSNCALCEFSKSKKNTIFGSNYQNQNIKIMFIGDYPGVIEDENGDIFLGKSSQTLTNMITKVLHLDINEIYYTNILKCRPPQNITPNIQEMSSNISQCIGYLHSQIRLIRPKILVALGEFSFDALNTQNMDFKQIRGNKIKYTFDNISVDLVATFHPNFFTRNPSAKVEAMQDLAIIKSLI